MLLQMKPWIWHLSLTSLTSSEAESATLASKNFIAYTLKSARGIIFRALETAI